jgi:16S rRNA (guanine966-N2)-methyltransferase
MWGQSPGPWPGRVSRPTPGGRTTRTGAPGRGPGYLRLIGGQYRSRRLPIPNHEGLRPTPDRVRETLFNWLQPILPGARCLDCFAGTGALGLEAASRGAAEVILLECAPHVLRQLEANVRTLGATQVQVLGADALAWLAGPGRPFDVVFLDPPYAAGLLAPVCDLIARNGWVRGGSRIYLEAQIQAGLPPLPSDWRLPREQRAGQVVYGLAQVETMPALDADRAAGGTAES